MHPRARLALGLGLAALSVAVSLRAGAHLAGQLELWAASLRGTGAAGLLGFGLAVLGCTLAGIIPGALLGVAAGAVFGFWAGLLDSAAFILLGAAAAFWLGRGWLRPLVAAWVRRHRRAAAFEGLLAAQGWRFVALLRVSPVMPFSLTSYALGASAVSGRAYLIGTLASLPALAGYVGIGALGGWGARLAGPGWRIHLALAALGGLATLGLLLVLGRLLRRALAGKTSLATGALPVSPRRKHG